MRQIVNLLGYEGLKIIIDPSILNFSTDTTVLADFVNIRLKDKNIIDLGTGTGYIPLFLSLKTKAKIYGIEIQKDIYDLFTGPLDSQKTGNYTIKVYWQREDHYGNTSSTYAGSFSISADELKKYRDYRHARSYLDLEDRLYNIAYNNHQTTWSTSTSTSTKDDEESEGWNWTAIIIAVLIGVILWKLDV